LGIFNDNDPYGPGGAVAAIAAYLASNPTVSGQNLSGLLQAAGIPWKTYQEDTNLLNTAGGNFNQGGTITNTPITDPSQLTVPLVSFSGTAATPPSKTATQTITVTNLLSSTISGPINIALDDLTPGVTLINSNGSSNEQEESPYITVVDSNSSLAAGDSASVTLQLKVPDLDGFAYDVREVFQQ
jgi:hypothetical protein